MALSLRSSEVSPDVVRTDLASLGSPSSPSSRALLWPVRLVVGLNSASRSQPTDRGSASSRHVGGRVAGTEVKGRPEHFSS